MTLACAFGAQRRLGPWVQTYSGRRFWPLDPRIGDVCLEDIAHALANVCRFGGHSKFHYSVAQHSVLVSRLCDPRDALFGLLHDAAEAYVGDMIRPIKHEPVLEPYCLIEWRVERVVLGFFGLTAEEMPESVRRADETALATEARDVMLGGQCFPWHLSASPLVLEFGADTTIVRMTPDEAETSFLDRYFELTRGAK
jgi:hypothetical protein